MAEMQWAGPVPAARAQSLIPALLRRLSARFLDWEDILTLILGLGAVTSVASGLESSGWSKHMPEITLVSVLAIVCGMVIARSSLQAVLAWASAFLLGGVVVFWQTLVTVGPGTLQDRADAVYLRFHAWFDVAFYGGVSNDSLPFNTLVLALTWVGVFLFAWSLFRWHNVWIGLIPGGIALVMDIVLVGDDLTSSVVLYALFGSLLVMRTNLTASMAEWRRKAVSYPPLISVSFLHFSLWALLGLVAVSWIAPVGPFATPAPVDSVIERIQNAGVELVRLAGPLHVKTISPVHGYSNVLPFQGSVSLGDRELLSVKLNDSTLQGPLLMRGSVYDQYTSGGWQVGDRRQTVTLPLNADSRVQAEVASGQIDGLLVPLTVQLEAKSVVGTVVFVPGQTVSSERPVQASVPAGSVRTWSLNVPGGGRNMTDEEVLAQWLPDDLIGLAVNRGPTGRVLSAEVFDASQQPVLDAVGLDPGDRIQRGESYNVTGFVPTVTPHQLQAAGEAYPTWVAAQYMQLPDSLPLRVGSLAQQIAGAAATPYDKAKAIQDYLRAYAFDYKVDDTPPGRDAVDYFLFDSRRGYFDYHASAMVVMLRSLGVPARLAVGFVADQADLAADGSAYVVKDKNSYAWPEVYFPGYGWMAFNPTPDRPADLTPKKKDLPVTALINPTLKDFPDLPVSAGSFNITGGDVASAGRSNSSSDADGGYVPWILVGLAGFALVVLVTARFGWQRSVAGLPYPQQIWEKTVRLASWAGHPPEPGQTPREYAERLTKVFRSVPEFGLLATSYSRSRFGRPDDEGGIDVARLKEVWPHVRGPLLSAMFGRLLRRR
jgi:transglutaminase-like putative cysteine protease